MFNVETSADVFSVFRPKPDFEQRLKLNKKLMKSELYFYHDDDDVLFFFVLFTIYIPWCQSIFMGTVILFFFYILLL